MLPHLLSSKTWAMVLLWREWLLQASTFILLATRDLNSEMAERLPVLRRQQGNKGR